ncbi:uncharacterized protein ACA1_279460 [Acanthamoeba castellanii str. Neff]|uniref:Protein phosphatase 1 regulatory subunit 21 n=1 Tax=Acanthamoeba castellanii (strain ATCC 30010 / Neff) TaxID=1257118 RepID=L8H620_ACACF|nr:uncharacterized protein ACA1_279460 [Acanthamoeba castellanii str. Neff]ELR20964.1 hypothetical protein ACA1_279460 [Acanthamoeba castellanii str. Neff]
MATAPSPPSTPDARPGLPLEERYVKLVEAYKKIKHQNGLLKQAVLQGREALQEETKLREATQLEAKEVEKKLRSAVEENNMLKFHNNRITKKVEALQRRFKEEEQTESLGWFSSGTKVELAKKKEELQAAKTDLESKIRENEKLHRENDELKKEHKQTVELLTQKIHGIKKNLQQQQDALRDKENETSFAINNLTQERDQLSSKSKILDDTLQRTQNLMKEREIAMTQIQQKLRDDLTKASSVLARKVLFDDSKNEVYNQFNVATFDRKRQQQQKEFVDVWLKHFRQFISHYGDYFSAFHERLLILNKSMTITDALRNINRKPVTAMAASYEQAKQPAQVDPQQAAAVAAINRYMLFNKKLLTYQLLRLEEESKQENCDDGMRARNELLGDTYTTMQSLLEKLYSYVCLAFGGEDGKVSKCNELFVVKQVHACLVSMNTAMKTYVAQLGSKIDHEHKDPFVLPALKSVNERIMQYQTSVATFFAKMSQSFELFLNLLLSPIAIPVRGVQVGTFRLEKRARDYLALVNSEPAPESIPYLEALNNKRTVADLDGARRLMQEKIQKLTQVNEHLLREKNRLQAELTSSKDTLASKQSRLDTLLSELVKVRQKHDALGVSVVPITTGAPTSPELLPAPDKEYGLTDNPAVSFDDEEQLATDTSDYERSVTGTPLLGSPLISFEEGANDAEEAAVEGSSPATTSSSLSLLDLDFGPPSTDGLSLMASDKERSFTASEVVGASKSYSLIVMDETGSQSDSLNLSEEDREREQALKKFYETRVDQLMSQIKEADRKAVELHEEYTKAVDSLASLVTQRDELQNKLSVAEKALAASKDELESTRSNYEQQMKLLSEHLVTLNEKIMAQEEQIGSIRSAQASGYPLASRGNRRGF